jgi:Uma2 family endonuclease
MKRVKREGVMSVQLARHRFTVDDFHRMAEAGIFSEDDRVELIDGEIVDMTAIGGPHLDCVNRLTHLFVKGVGDRATVSVQNPVRLGRLSQPLPDLALIRPRSYAQGVPEPGDVFLLIEVADTTAAWDRESKLPVYARGGVPEVWLVDLRGRVVEVYRTPLPQGYGDVRVFLVGQLVAPAAFPDLSLAVDDVLG